MKQHTSWSASKVIVAAVAVFILSVSVTPSAGTRQLTFEERVKAQQAIEQVYWNHRIWPEQNHGAKPSLGEVLPESAIRSRVTSYLGLSDTLESSSGRPISEGQLQDELNRMIAQTRAPDVLRELFAALENDPLVIEETLVRQKLVEPLAAAPASITRGPSSTLTTGCGAEAWNPTSTGLGVPQGRELHSAVWTGSEMIVWGGWSQAALLQTGGRYDPATDTWTPTALTGAPEGRFQHTAVWTGSEMIVWGGGSAAGDSQTGGRYNPATDTWRATSSIGAPEARQVHTGVWTGTEMIVWGGIWNYGIFNTGGRYNPATDTWTPTSVTGAPEGRYYHTADWTGSRMIIWGGNATAGGLQSGGRYDPATDTWTPTTTVGAPEGRDAHTAVWTGSAMIVWGGRRENGPITTGGRYDPTADLWVPTANLGVPPGCDYHTAVWTGSEMIVWGGSSTSGGSQTGARYVPASDTWTPTTTVLAPEGRARHTAVWTGSEMIVWGGLHSTSDIDSGGRYCPGCDDHNPCTIDSLDPVEGCTHAVTVGAPCDDGNSCTAQDSCNATAFCAGQPPSPNAPCDDGNACTTGDICDIAGTCVGGPPTHCDDQNVCTSDTCDMALGCVHSPNAAPCSDGNACTWNDACAGGSCRGGPPLNCNDANPCTTDSCDPFIGCVHAPVPDTLCCAGGVPTNCNDGNPCKIDTCDPSTGNCIHTPVATGTPCDDGNPCTIADSCVPPGVCTGAWRFCDDFSRCTDDSCDPATGCVFTPVVCDDHNACTSDYCSSYSGCGHVYLCEDYNHCTSDVCDPATGCSHIPYVLCDDSNVCTDDACNPATGMCDFTARVGPCNDNNLCTSGETCQAGTCTPAFNGLNHPNPKSAGYYRKLCEKRAQGHLPYQGDQLTDADAVCVGQLTATFSGISTIDDICNVIDKDQHGGRHHGGPGDGPDGKDCDKGEDELIATALNVCRARVCEAQSLDSKCHGNTHTTVSQSLADADAILDDPARDKDSCKSGRCELREINNGHALEMNSLVVSAENDTVRLTWSSPVLDDGSGTPTTYEIWRRPLGSNDPFVKIGTVKALTFLDRDTGTAPWEYEITAVIP